jgi:type IV pilus assembly protein PilB
MNQPMPGQPGAPIRPGAGAPPTPPAPQSVGAGGAGGPAGGPPKPSVAGKKLRLGDALISEGLINEEQLMQALALQKKSGKRLGNVLVEMHLVTEQDIVQILSKQLRIPFIDLSIYLIDPVFAKLIPEHIAKRHLLIPINKVGNKLTVAMVDPLNIIAIDDIQLMSGLMVKPVVATQSDINKALQDAYGAVAQQDKLMDDLEDIGAADEDGILTVLVSLAKTMRLSYDFVT